MSKGVVLFTANCCCRVCQNQILVKRGIKNSGDFPASKTAVAVPNFSVKQAPKQSSVLTSNWMYLLVTQGSARRDSPSSSYMTFHLTEAALKLTRSACCLGAGIVSVANRDLAVWLPLTLTRIMLLNPCIPRSKFTRRSHKICILILEQPSNSFLFKIALSVTSVLIRDLAIISEVIMLFKII